MDYAIFEKPIPVKEQNNLNDQNELHYLKHHYMYEYVSVCFYSFYFLSIMRMCWYIYKHMIMLNHDMAIMNLIVKANDQA